MKILLTFFLLILCMSFVSAISPLEDASGNGYNLSNSGALYNTSGYYTFNSTSTTILTRPQFIYNISKIGIFAWVLTTNNSLNSDIVSQSDGSGTASQENFELNLNAGAVRLLISNGTSRSTTAQTTQILANNTWYYVGCVYNGTTIDCYINGVRNISTGVVYGNIAFNTSRVFNIGKVTTGTQIYHSGFIDDVKIFVNVVPNSTQVLDLYNGLDISIKPNASYFFNNNTCKYYPYISTDWNITTSDNCSITTDTTVPGWVNIFGYNGITTFLSQLNTVAITKQYVDPLLTNYLPMLPETSNSTYTKDYVNIANSPVVTLGVITPDGYYSNGTGSLQTINMGGKYPSTVTSTNANFSFSLWFNYKSINTENDTGLFACSFLYGLQLRDSNTNPGALRYGFRNSTTLQLAATAVNVTYPNRWYNAVFSYNNGNKNLSLFINGNLTSSFTVTITNMNMTGATCTFPYNIVGGNPSKFNGTMKDFRFWNRTLTVTDAQGLYAGTYNGAIVMASGRTSDLLLEWAVNPDVSNTTNSVDTGFQKKFNGTNTAVAFDSSRGYTYNGVNSVTRYTNSAAPVVMRNNNISISMWIKESTTDYANKPTIGLFSIYNSSNSLMMLGYIPANSSVSNYGQLRLDMRNSTGSIFYPGTTANNCFKNVTNWTHIVVAYSLNATVFCNGVQIYTTTIQGGAFLDNYTRVDMGQGQGPIMNGSMDDFRIYNHTLSLQEVSNLYTVGMNKYINIAPMNDPTLKLFLPFNIDNSNSTYTKDYSSTLHNLTLQGMTFNPTYGYTFNGFDKQNNMSVNSYMFDTNVNSTFSTSFDVLMFSNTTSSSAPTYSIFLSTLDGSSKNNWRINYLSSSNRLEFYIANATTSTNCAITSLQSTLNTWHKVVARYNNTNYNIRWDSQTANCTVGTFIMNNVSQYLWIGSQAAVFQMNGSIDNVKFYNRYLSDAEVNREYTLSR